MSKSIHLGQSAGGKRFTLPIELVTETTAVLGRRGSGKTNTAVVCAEELLEAGQQVVILDPLDACWGLKSSKDGKSAGYNVAVFGDPAREYTDLELAEGQGEGIADLIVAERVPAVLSMRHLSKSGQRRFVAAFAERFFERKGAPGNETPVLVIIDEASTFVPQRFTGEAARMVGAIEALVRRGRKSGIGVMLVDQRPASVNKDVLTQLEVLVSHQVTSPQDRKALQEWVEAHDTHDQAGPFFGSIASLQRGETWVWSPGWLDVFERVKVRERHSFDSSRTPKVGERAVVPTKLAAFDIERLRQRLPKVVEEAKANDPKELRKRIADLQRQLQAKPDTAPDPHAVDRAVRAAIVERDQFWRLQMTGLLNRVAALSKGLRETLRPILESGPQLLERLYDAARTEAASPPTPATAAHVPPRPDPRPRVASAPATRHAASTGNAGDVSINASMRRMLAVLVQRQQMGQPTTDDRTLAAQCGIKKSGGTFGTYVSRLRTAGLIEGDRGAMRVTPAGKAAAGQVEPLPTGRALVEHYKRTKLNATQGQMLDAIVAAYPGSISRADIAEAVGVGASGGTFGTYLSRMRGLGLIEGSGSIRATDALMEGSSP